MTLLVTAAPNNTLTPDTSSFVHIRSMEVKFKGERTKYPISIKTSFGESEVEKSKQYARNEAVHWLFERQLSPESQFTVHVREHRSFRRTTNLMTVPVSASKLVTRPFFEITGSDTSPVSVRIHSGSRGPFIDVIRRLVRHSQDQLEAMRPFLEKLGVVCEALDYVVTITDAVSSVHPAAESAASVATKLLEFCQKLTECHTSASELMGDIAAFLPFTEIPERGLKCKVTAQTTKEMLVLFEKTCRAIIKYTDGSVLGSLLDDRIDEIRSFKGRFKRMKETFGWCLTTEMWKTTMRIEENTDILLLKHILSPLTEAPYSEDKLCFEGSRRDTLGLIEAWSESESSPKLFWMYGPPGLGKTSIAHRVAKLFHDQNRLVSCLSFEDGQDPKRIMPTVAYHLAEWHADYQEYILNILRGPRKADVFAGLDRQFELLMKRPLSEISIHSPPVHRPLVIVLDALENCCDTEECRRSFVDYIVDIATLVPWLKVFVTNRRSKHVEMSFHRVGSQVLDIDDPMLDLYHDITVYANLCSEPRKSLSWWTSRKENDVHRLFARIHWSFIPSIQGTMGKESDIPAIRVILAIISFVVPIRPPTKEVVFHFLRAIQPYIAWEHFQDIITSLSAIIKTTSDNILLVSLPHEMFKQSGHFCADMKPLKHSLARHCMDVLHTEPRFNICDLDDPRVKIEDVPVMKKRIDAHIPERLRYCSLSWVDLVSHSGDVELYNEAVASFLRSREALFWLEILGLLGELDAGKGILSECMVQFKEDDKIFLAAKELHAFTSQFEPAMKISIPHLHISALMWLPSNSPIAGDLARGLPPNPSVAFERLAEPTENAVLIDSSSRILCTSRSSDGSRIVSGTSDGTLEIWDGWIGERIGMPIKGHSDRINDVKFSSDGTKLVSGSSDKTVKIWDAQTGRLIEELKSDGNVEAVAYSADGGKVISGHGDGRIRIWDARRGTLIVELQGGHKRLVHSVAYSPDGRRIVSASYDAVQIWDAKSGAAVGEPPISHDDSVTCSPDGSRIISGSWDNTVRVWNAHTGTPVGKPLKGHEGRVVDVGYSRDGKTIMSASWDKTIRFWNATDNAPVGVLLRGESRWDPVRGHFVSIPKWWPIQYLKSFNLQSLVYSPNPLYIPDDGWIRTLDGGLLLWVPPEHRACSCHAASESTYTGNSCDERLKKSAWKDIPQWRDITKVMADVH